VKLCIRRYPLVRCIVDVLECILFCWAAVVRLRDVRTYSNSCVDVSFQEAQSSIIDDHRCSNQA
jgi:hypothetical protein